MFNDITYADFFNKTILESDKHISLSIVIGWF